MDYFTAWRPHCQFRFWRRTARFVYNAQRHGERSSAGMEGDIVTLQDLYLYKQLGLEADGKVKGSYSPTGVVPSFIEELKAKGIDIDYSAFMPQF